LEGDLETVVVGGSGHRREGVANVFAGTNNVFEGNRKSPSRRQFSGHRATTLDQLASRLKSADVDGDGEPEAIADWLLPKEVISFPQGEPVVVVLQNAEICEV